jgi:hypothetical protein
VRQCAGYAGLTGHERDKACPRGDAAARVRQMHHAKVHFGARRDGDAQQPPSCQPSTAWAASWSERVRSSKRSGRGRSSSR